jgi:hypothetical protein
MNKGWSALLWPFVPILALLLYAGLRSFSVPPQTWSRPELAAGFILMVALSAFGSARRVAKVRLGRRPDSDAERQMINQWLSRLSMSGKPPEIVQFSFLRRTPHPQDAYFLGLGIQRWSRTDIVRLLFEDQWIALAVFRDQELNKLIELVIFDARTTAIEYVPEKKRFRIGSRSFDMVEYTPELTTLANQLAHGSAAVLH